MNNIICIVAVVCTITSRSSGKADYSCEITRSECQISSEDEEKEMRKKCDAAPNCIEMSPRVFVIREKVEEKTPAPSVKAKP